jgi:hypothetical protein
MVSPNSKTIMANPKWIIYAVEKTSFNFSIVVEPDPSSNDKKRDVAAPKEVLRKENRRIVPATTLYSPKSTTPSESKIILDVNNETNIVIAVRIYSIIVFLAIRLLPPCSAGINFAGD